jgi:F-type H+-transporting ATPase subunit gamma
VESFERLRRRVDTLGELHTIVRTMKAFSAASIRQYEQSVIALQDYVRTVELGLGVVLQTPSLPATQLLRGGLPSGMVVLGSDHGLCGRFNEDIADSAMQGMASSTPGVQLLVVGSRVAAILEQAGYQPALELRVPATAERIAATVHEVLATIEHWRSHGQISRVTLFYNRPLGVSGYGPVEVALLPVDLQRLSERRSGGWPSRGLPTFTMPPEHLLSDLLRQYFFVSIFRACAESQASEHASRLAAMQAAEKNLQERMEELTAQLRRIRQETITTELLDVVSGFQAVVVGGDSDG